MNFESIGPYRLEEELARGGMGVVYRTRDPVTGEPLAIKLLLSGLGESDTARRRFQREAEALARLDHPHVVRVRDVGEHESIPFLVMDLIRGRSLQERLDQAGPLDPDLAVRWITQAARGLAHAHDRGVLHRDLKPANVLLDDQGQARVTDFGLARDMAPQESSASRLSRTGQLMGTPGFWPPEQARGDLSRIGPGSDVYGLGATLYALLTGRPPHQGETLVELLGKIDSPPTPIRKLRPDVPAGLAAVCERCLSNRPQDRYPTAAALVAALETCSQVQPSRPDGPAAVTVITLGVISLGVIGALGVLALRRDTGPQPASSTPARRAPATSALAAEEIRATILRAGELEAAGKSNEALDALDRAVVNAPKAPGLRSARGTIHVRAQRYADAEVDARAALAVDPAHLPSWELLITVLTEQERYVEAIEALERALRSAPDHLAFSVRRLQILGTLGRQEEALNAAEGILAAHPDQLDALRLRAVACLTLQRYAEAIPQLVHLANVFQDAGDAANLERALNMLTQARAGRRLQASTTFEEACLEGELGLASQSWYVADLAFTLALELRPGAPRALAGRAIARAWTGDLAGTEKDLAAARAQGPDSPWLDYAEAYLLAISVEGRFPEALRRLDAALLRFPGSGPLLRLRAATRSSAGDPRGSLADIEAAIGDLDDAMLGFSLYVRGVAHRRAGAIELAQASYEPAVAALPNFPHVHAELGSLRYEQLREEESRRLLDRAIELGPLLPGPYVSRARLALEQGDLETARRAAVRATLLPNPLVGAWVVLAQTERLQGRLAEAEDALEQAFRLRGGPSGVLWAARAELLLAQGADREALSQSERAVQLEPDHSGVVLARARILLATDQAQRARALLSGFRGTLSARHQRDFIELLARLD